LILGISPITIAVYGNFQQKEIAFKHLFLPSLLIMAGLLIINIPHFEASNSHADYLLGLMFSVFALLAWSWYVVSNARFLKHHSHVHSSDWSTVLGVSTLCWVFLVGLVLTFFFEEQFQIEKYFVYHESLQRFLIGSAILGLVSSWLGAYLWNKASVYLPVSLAGQLTIFETIFGILFVYTAEKTMPSLVDIIGIMILLSAIAYAMKSFVKKKDYTKQIAPH
jgi:drug/metabolite transporter (DMT)-like permease